MDLWSQQKGISPPPAREGPWHRLWIQPMGIPLFFRCEGVKFQSLKAVSVTLKENYSIPERCLGMRDMLKKFRGEGAAPGTFGLWFPPYPGAQGGFSRKLCPAAPSVCTDEFRLVSFGKIFVVILDGL